MPLMVLRRQVPLPSALSLDIPPSLTHISRQFASEARLLSLARCQPAHRSLIIRFLVTSVPLRKVRRKLPHTKEPCPPHYLSSLILLLGINHLTTLLSRSAPTTRPTSRSPLPTTVRSPLRTTTTMMTVV